MIYEAGRDAENPSKDESFVSYTNSDVAAKIIPLSQHS